MAHVGTGWTERVEEIVAMDDRPILRNLLITQTYHDLSRATSQILGQQNATWATYGCWASKTAGPYIRGEEIPTGFRSVLTSSRAIQQHTSTAHSALRDVKDAIESPLEAVLGTARTIAEDVKLYILQGNKVVFEEVGGAFAAFIEAFGDGRPTKKALDDLISRYEVGPVHPDDVEIDTQAGTATSRRRGGQSLLRGMLQHYHAAMLETNPSTKAQLIMLGNAQGGLHEQTRLQNYIAGSLNAPIDDLVRVGMHEHARKGTRGHSILHDVHAALDRVIHPVADAVKSLWRAFSTLELMKMKLPDGTLRLGRDVPAPPGGPLFPKDLKTIRFPALRTMLQQYDALAGGGTDKHGFIGKLEEDIERLAHKGLIHQEVARSHALDWSNLSQRMRYILEYFRSRQQDPVLFDQPFSAEQRTEIEAGTVPGGDL